MSDTEEITAPDMISTDELDGGVDIKHEDRHDTGVYMVLNKHYNLDNCDPSSEKVSLEWMTSTLETCDKVTKYNNHGFHIEEEVVNPNIANVLTNQDHSKIQNQEDETNDRFEDKIAKDPVFDDKVDKSLHDLEVDETEEFGSANDNGKVKTFGVVNDFSEDDIGDRNTRLVSSSKDKKPTDKDDDESADDRDSRKNDNKDQQVDFGQETYPDFVSKSTRNIEDKINSTFYGADGNDPECDIDSDLEKTVLENVVIGTSNGNRDVERSTVNSEVIKDDLVKPSDLTEDTDNSGRKEVDTKRDTTSDILEYGEVQERPTPQMGDTLNFRLSGTGNEFIHGGDVKVELQETKQGNDDVLGDDNEEMGYNYEDEDIWALPEFESEETPWSELSRNEKIKKVLWHYIGKGILTILLLYIFICSLSFLGDAFKLLGGKAAGKTFTNVNILSNRLAGVIIGILATVLLQSSSTTTSIVVSMVGSGSLLTVRQAIPIVMGANIGTTITNTIVAIGQINHKADFRRAFAGATVHDAFNWLNVLVMLLLEEIFGFLEALTGAIVKNFKPGETSGSENDYLKALTDPFTKLIVQIDKDVITQIATGNITDDDQSIIKHECGNSKCKFMFENVSSSDGGGWSDAAVGVVLLLIALFLLCACLILIVKILHSLLKGQIAKWIRKFINANLPGKLAYFTGYIALLIGAGVTILVQSSSIFTSSLTPLVGMGVLSLDRMYPLTLGSNIGTTGTGIIAAFAQDPAQIKDALQIALCHLFFNITGILIFYPIPFMRLPIRMAKFLGIRSAEYRWFAILYIIFPFFILPTLGLGLSLIHIALTITLLVLVAAVIIVIVIVKILQKRFPRILPKKFRDWKWLPEWMRSLEPTDRLIKKVLKRLGRLKVVVLCRRRCPCKCCSINDDSDV